MLLLQELSLQQRHLLAVLVGQPLHRLVHALRLLLEELALLQDRRHAVSESYMSAYCAPTRQTTRSESYMSAYCAPTRQTPRRQSYMSAH